VLMNPSLLYTVQLGMNVKGVMNMASQVNFESKPWERLIFFLIK
jgi:hypothetical protein